MKWIPSLCLISLFLIGCSSDAENPEAPSNGEAAQALDLSLPKTDLGTDKTSLPQPQDKLPDLFNQEKTENAISISASPTFEAGEALLDTPKVNGGNVNLEVKID